MNAENESRNDASSTPEPPPAQAEGAARRTIDHIKLENFTAFRKFDMSFVPGINAFIGENATGKTHLLKLIYYACRHGGEVVPAVTHLEDYFFFVPFQARWNLINFDARGREASIAVKSRDDTFERTLEYQGSGEPGIGFIFGGEFSPFRHTGEIPAVLVPAKEMLSHNKYFRSTYAKREIYFEKQYVDVLDAAGLGPLKRTDPRIEDMLHRVEGKIGGTVVLEDEVYYLKRQDGRLLEFTLVAEGHRRLGLLWLLLRNGEIAPGSVLLWDEPESNLNPKLIGVAMQVLLELQRIGVQIFFATHSYIALEELNLRRLPKDRIMYHSLFREKETDEIRCQSTEDFDLIEPNDILQAYADVLDRHVKRELGRGGDERSH